MLVAIVGRSNVGKSTIFNRMIGQKKAIVFDTPGVTRDRLIEKTSYKDKEFFVMDTGGFELTEENFQKEINMQVELALDKADLILFVMDGTEGLTEGDRYISRLVNKTNKPVIAVVNKVDSKAFKDHEFDFYELGSKDLIFVSSEANIGFYELFDTIYPHIKEENDDFKGIKFAILGKENTGKSSLLNAMLKEDRNIVSNIPGTTRDSVDSLLKYHGEEFLAIDTAGIKKRGKIYENLDKYSYLRTIQALERADVCLVTIDGSEELSIQDKHIAGLVHESGKPLIFIVTKWDENLLTKERMKALIKLDLAFASYAPIIFTSSVTKEGVFSIIPVIKDVYENATQEIKTSALNKVFEEAYLRKLPPTYKGKRLRINYVVQVKSLPPTFVLYVNNPKLVHFSYDRYLKNRLREAFNLEGTPIVLSYRFKNKKSS